MHLVRYFNSINTRLMISMIILTAFTVFGFTLINYYQHQQSEQTYFETKAQTIMSPLFEDIRREIPVHDGNILIYLKVSLNAKESTLLPQLINSYKELDAVTFYDMSQIQIASVGDHLKTPIANQLHIDLPFTVADQQIGTVQLIFNNDYFNDLQQQLINNSLSYLWVFLIIGIIGARLLGNSITDPIRHLAMHLKNGDLHHPPYQDRNDEIGAISRTVHQLAGSLEEKESTLKQLAYNDSLTGLANRPSLLKKLNHLLHIERQDIAVLFIDLNGFKYVNDTYGHHIGDDLLCQVANRMQSKLQQTDIIARISGDEFIIVLTSAESDDAVENFCDQLTQALDSPFELAGHLVHISASIGIAQYPKHDENAEMLLNLADRAMYHAKSFGGTQFRFYQDELYQHHTQRLNLQSALKKAIIDEDIDVYFQPQFSLQTQKLSGIEALARWTHPQYGPIGPDQFIPLAEETGLIHSLGTLVLDKSCAQMKKWLALGLSDIKMAVNLSPKQFNDPRLISQLKQTLGHYQLPPEHLEIEITESTAMHQAIHAVDLIDDINALGISLALDDFGTGYSSLSRLKQFQLRLLKIDKSFIQDLVENEHNRSIVKAIMSMTKELKLEVIAEGIESQEQLALLTQFGVQQGQGYLFSKPISAEQFTEKFISPPLQEDEPERQYS